MNRIEYGNTLSVEEYTRIRESVGWAGLNEKQAQTGLEHSTRIVSARDAERAVGMARLISDGGYVAYIADVIVTPAYQKQGIAKTMVNAILTFIRERMEPGDRVMVVLVAAKGRESFYQQFDFQVRPNAMDGAGMTMWLTKDE